MLKVTWFLDGLKAEDGSTVSISKSAMFSDSTYSEDLDKVISRLSLGISGNKANIRFGNYLKNGGKSLNIEYAKWKLVLFPRRNLQDTFQV